MAVIGLHTTSGGSHLCVTSYLRLQQAATCTRPQSEVMITPPSSLLRFTCYEVRVVSTECMTRKPRRSVVGVATRRWCALLFFSEFCVLSFCQHRPWFAGLTAAAAVLKWHVDRVGVVECSQSSLAIWSGSLDRLDAPTSLPFLEGRDGVAISVRWLSPPTN